MNVPLKAILCLSILPIISSANGASLTYDEFFSSAPTNWNFSVNIPKFSVPSQIPDSASYFIHETLRSGSKIEELHQDGNIITAYCNDELLSIRHDLWLLSWSSSSVIGLSHIFEQFHGIIDFAGIETEFILPPFPLSAGIKIGGSASSYEVTPLQATRYLTQPLPEPGMVSLLVAGGVSCISLLGIRNRRK